MSRKRWPLVILGTVLASTAWAAAATGTVKGVVSTRDGPLVGARVVISSGSDSSYSATATTDRDGRFSFSDAPLGDVEVKVYDSRENILASGKGVLKSPGEVITLLLDAVSS